MPTADSLADLLRSPLPDGFDALDESGHEKLADQLRHTLDERAARLDAAIDTSDLPESGGWDRAERGRFWRPVKRSVTIRLDADVLAWFRRREPNYQTAINRVLRAHMEGKGGLGRADG